MLFRGGSEEARFVVTNCQIGDQTIDLTVVKQLHSAVAPKVSCRLIRRPLYRIRGG